MSMPQLPSPDTILTREQAINAILASIAMEETALGHLINAESEKIQYAIEYVKSKNSSADLQKLLEINKSAAAMLEQIGDIQVTLKNKLRLAMSCFPPTPPLPPCPPCFCQSVFLAVTDCVWASGCLLCFTEAARCENGVHLCKDCRSGILLAGGKKYIIELTLDSVAIEPCPVLVEAELRCGGNVIHSKELASEVHKCSERISQRLTWDTPPGHECCALTIRLLSPKCLKISSGKILIREI